MCRPSCCNSKSSHEGAGIAAVAVIAGAVLVAVRIGPIVARILHVIAEIFTIVTLTAASALACIVLGWLTVRLVRWQLRSRHAHVLATLRPAPADRITRAGSEPGCLACGDTRTVLHVISGSRYQARPCPQCVPAQRAG